MEQTNSLAMNMLQSIASQAAGIPKTGKADGDQPGDFQKLLEEKAQEKDPLLEQPAKTQPKAEAAPAKKTENAPVQKQENSLERVKKLAEQGYPVVQPSIGMMTLDGQMYQPGEYVEVWTPNGVEIIPTTDLDETQMGQLQQILDGMGTQVIDVSDPEADALLEATDPNVDHSPAAMLEKVTAGQFGKEVQQTMEKAQPQAAQQQEGEDSEVELLEVEQAPQRIFRDVEAAPVKVGETEKLPQAEQPDVVRQIDAPLVQALEKGESMVRIQLTPEHLGTVTIEISQSAQGILRVALSAHSGETRSLLERHAGDLQGLLSSRTQQTVEVDIQRGQESQQNQQHQQNYEGHNGHAQDGREQRRQRREHTSSQDFMQQLRLGLIPTDGEF